ncbi:tape measure protein [Acinetobacter sp. R933-2]|uniref:tape measure protein n=1 Tax=Acinetobacter sp. R933-2 TaxID=2746728 RepID=UPI00257823C9|nr:tape measure protein [Acinetobacter sp. R933-2]MDM1247923.1 tape measure protein [Acinetobacter sp. R933-2]
MARDLTFKLILNADTNNLTQNLERSSDAAKQMFDRIKQEADRLRQSMQMSDEVSTLVQSFDNARLELNRLSDASEVSSENIQQMGEYGQQAINRMQSELQEARLELNRLSATNATPHDIQNAQDRVRQLERGIDQTRIAVEAYQDAARAASETPPVPTEFQQQISRLVTNLDDVRNSIDQNGRSATHTREQLEQLARNATQQLQLYEQQLESARLEVNRLAATNATPEDIERARQRVRELETGIDQATNSLRGFENAAGRGTRELEQGANRSDAALGKVGRSINVLQGAMAALGIGFGVHELAQIADNFQNISAQVNLVSNDSKELYEALEGVRQVATRTTSSLESTANLYARINQAGKDLGVTQKQALQITEAINQSIQISGGSAASADAAITQLIQGLQSGVLRGEEFNSMMEQAPRLTTALADSLNVTKGELRAMAGEGKLTAEVVIKALKEQSAVIAEEYTKIPTTIGGALTNLKTNFTMLIGEIDSTNAASKGIVSTLLMLSENLDVLKTLFNDTTQGVSYFGEILGTIDPSIIESVKNAIVTAYDAIKILISTVVDVGVTIFDTFSTGLDVLFSWSGVIDGEVNQSVSGLAVIINSVAIAIGALSDGTKAIGIGVSFLVGAFYDVAAAATYYIKMLTWGDVRKKLDDDYKVLTEQRDKYYAEAEKKVLEFESSTKKALDNSVLNADQANQKKLADHKANLTRILSEEAKAEEQLKTNAEKRTELQAKLAEARANNDTVAIGKIVKESNALDEVDNRVTQNRVQRDKDKLESAKILAESSMALNKGVLSDLTKEEFLRDGVIATINDQGKLEVTHHENSIRQNAERFAKLEALSVEEKKLAQNRVTSTQETGNAIIQNEAFIASEKVRLNDVANAALKAGNFEAYSQAKLDLDALGGAQVKANQQRVDQHQQSNNAIQQIDASSFAMQKNYSDEQVRLSQVAVQARKAGDFDAWSQAMLQIDRLAASQTQADQRVSQSDLDTLRKKEEITQEKVSLAQQIIDSTNGIITKEQELQFTSQGLVVEYDEQGKAVIKRSQTFSEAAKALGLDTSQALNLVSEEFTKSEASLDVVINGLQDMGATGKQATDMIYQGWQKWADQAKNQAEIDAAKAKLVEFEKQGVLSAKQVQMGMEYLDQVNAKIPENISEIEKAYKLLGVTSSIEADKMASAQMNAFNVMKQSGTASAEQIRQALINMADKIYASGNAAKIAWYEGELAAAGLSSSVDEAGKVTVDAGTKMEHSMHRVRDATRGAQQGFRDLGAVAREEALSTTEAWAKALDAQSGGMHKTPQGSKTRMAYNTEEIAAELKAMGYDDKRAKEIAEDLYQSSKGPMNGYKSASSTWLAKNGYDSVGAFANGGGGLSNTLYIKEALEKYQSYAPSTNTVSISNPKSTRRLEVSNGQQTAKLEGSDQDVDTLESIMSEFEMLKKST